MKKGHPFDELLHRHDNNTIVSFHYKKHFENFGSMFKFTQSALPHPIHQKDLHFDKLSLYNCHMQESISYHASS